MLSIRNVSKRFGAHAALASANLEIQGGEFFSLLGPSGCGKTTLLRLISGFERPDSGEIWLDSTRIDPFPSHRRPFNLVFQKYALFPHLTVRQNISFGLEMKKVPRAEIASRTEEALALVRMEGFADRSVTTLSGGQQQRIALARALVNRPKVLLLDEPLSALDLKLRQQMQVELLALQKKLGSTFIFVTHDQDEALTLSSRLAVMNGGKIEQVGTPQEIYEYPRSPFVARFIGSVNEIRGVVASRTDDAIELQCPAVGASRLWVKASQDGVRPLVDVSVGGEAEILVRPEKIKLLKSQPSGAALQNAVEVTLREVLYLGPVTQFVVSPLKGAAGGQQTWMVSQANAAHTSKRTWNAGDRAWAVWSPEDSVVLSVSGNASEGESPASGTALRAERGEAGTESSESSPLSISAGAEAVNRG